uniref:BAG domain-containing protein n=1 Tax=Rhabditophanes sp. KR3021 TaxID=114890 RepID=A0AC35U447_9BILA
MYGVRHLGQSRDHPSRNQNQQQNQNQQANQNANRLRRTHLEDPFSNYPSAFDTNMGGRIFGSNPRLFDNDNFFQNNFHNDPFASLPRGQTRSFSEMRPGSFTNETTRQIPVRTSPRPSEEFHQTFYHPQQHPNNGNNPQPPQFQNINAHQQPQQPQYQQPPHQQPQHQQQQPQYQDYNYGNRQHSYNAPQPEYQQQSRRSPPHYQEGTSKSVPIKITKTGSVSSNDSNNDASLPHEKEYHFNGGEKVNQNPQPAENTNAGQEKILSTDPPPAETIVVNGISINPNVCSIDKDESLHTSNNDNAEEGDGKLKKRIKAGRITREASIDDFNSQIIELLDTAEHRVEKLREQAAALEQEKEQLLDTLKYIKLNTDLLRFEEGQREDVEATAARILKRCNAVSVSVNTPRNADQAEALANINVLLEKVCLRLRNEFEDAKQCLSRYQNACDPGKLFYSYS